MGGAVAGEDEALVTELAGCLGEWAPHAAAEDLSASLAAGPLSDRRAASAMERQGRALTLAFTVQCGLLRCELSSPRLLQASAVRPRAIQVSTQCGHACDGATTQQHVAHHCLLQRQVVAGNR